MRSSSVAEPATVSPSAGSVRPWRRCVGSTPPRVSATRCGGDPHRARPSAPGASTRWSVRRRSSRRPRPPRAAASRTTRPAGESRSAATPSVARGSIARPHKPGQLRRDARTPRLPHLRRDPDRPAHPQRGPTLAPSTARTHPLDRLTGVPVHARYPRHRGRRRPDPPQPVPHQGRRIRSAHRASLRAR